MIAGGKMTHLPIRAYSLRGAALVGRSIYVRGFKTPLAPDGGFRPSDLMHATHLRQAALGCTYFGNMFFGHFWTDDVPLMQLAREFAEPVRTSLGLTGHQSELLDLLELRPRLSSSLQCEELIVFDDPAQTKSKENRYRGIRQVFAEKFRRPDPPRGVFLFRGEPERSQSRERGTDSDSPSSTWNRVRSS